MIARPGHLERLRFLFGIFPVVGLIGARQVGKTTLAMAFAGSFAGEVTSAPDPRNASTGSCTAAPSWTR